MPQVQEERRWRRLGEVEGYADAVFAEAVPRHYMTWVISVSKGETVVPERVESIPGVLEDLGYVVTWVLDPDDEYLVVTTHESGYALNYPRFWVDVKLYKPMEGRLQLIKEGQFFLNDPAELGDHPLKPLLTQLMRSLLGPPKDREKLWWGMKLKVDLPSDINELFEPPHTPRSASLRE